MAESKCGELRVPGAVLHYQLQGEGPLLLILQGGAGDADASAALAAELASECTVLTYDRRGLSRSRRDEPTAPTRIETHADDVHRLLAAHGAEPVLVFGASIGALIGLELVTRHPEQVRTLVAHDPPAPSLLSDTERESAERTQRALEELQCREGVPAAMQAFLASIGVDFRDREPEVEMPPHDPMRAANMRFFLERDCEAAHRYVIEIPALKAASTKILPAGGRTSRECFPSRCAAVLAERLGVTLVEFPGGHSGYVLRPREFAVRLREVLGIARSER